MVWKEEVMMSEFSMPATNAITTKFAVYKCNLT